MYKDYNQLNYELQIKNSSIINETNRLVQSIYQIIQTNNNNNQISTTIEPPQYQDYIDDDNDGNNFYNDNMNDSDIDITKRDYIPDPNQTKITEWISSSLLKNSNSSNQISHRRRASDRINESLIFSSSVNRARSRSIKAKTRRSQTTMIEAWKQN